MKSKTITAAELKLWTEYLETRYPQLIVARSDAQSMNISALVQRLGSISGLLDPTQLKEARAAFESRNQVPPASETALPKIDGALGELPTFTNLPEVLGNESWRAAAEHWEASKMTSAHLLKVPSCNAPGRRFSAEHEAMRSKLAWRNEYANYAEGRAVRLRFEVKRCSGVLMKPFESSEKPRRIRAACGAFYTPSSPVEDSERESYRASLSNHLAALLTQLSDQQLAAEIRADNFA